MSGLALWYLDSDITLAGPRLQTCNQRRIKLIKNHGYLVVLFLGQETTNLDTPARPT